MRVWRICAGRHPAETLTGRGGLLTPGRWHSAGHPIVYTSASLALAALEVLVHVDKDMIPAGMAQVEIDIPDDIAVLTIGLDVLPNDWQLYPAPSELQRLGDEWLASRSTPVLQVPSSVIPREANYLLNPLHPDMPRVTVASVASFTYERSDVFHTSAGHHRQRSPGDGLADTYRLAHDDVGTGRVPRSRTGVQRHRREAP